MDATTPLDSVDYWIDFDKDDGLASIPESYEAPRPTTDGRGQPSMARRRVGPLSAPILHL